MCIHENVGIAQDGSDTFWCWDCSMQLVPLDDAIGALKNYFIENTVCGDFAKSFDVLEAMRHE